MKCDQYGTAEEAEQASAEGISQQTARKLVRYIARDAHRAEWGNL